MSRTQDATIKGRYKKITIAMRSINLYTMLYSGNAILALEGKKHVMSYNRCETQELKIVSRKVRGTLWKKKKKTAALQAAA